MTPKFQADLAKAFATFKLPQVDLKSLTDLQSKNVDAMLKASQLMAEAGKAVAKFQMELATAAIEDAMKTSQAVIEAKTAEAKFATQVEAAKASYGKLTQSAKELADMIAKPGQKAADILQKRFIAQTQEFEAMVAAAA
jgi:phasin family protein